MPRADPPGSDSAGAPDDELWTRARFEALAQPFQGEDPPDSPRGKKRKRLLDAATRLFLKHGYRKTSVDDIARAARVAKGTVYTFFESKGALLVAAIAQEKMVMIRVLDPMLSGELPPEQHLRFYVRVLLRCVRELPLSMRLLRDDEIRSVMEEFSRADYAARQQQGIQMVAALIGKAAPALSAEEREARARIFHPMSYLIAHLDDEEMLQGSTFEALTQTLEDVLVAGMIAPPPEAR